MDIMSLDRLAQEIGGPLPLIAGMGDSLVEPTGFILMNVKVPCVQGYDEDQVALVMDDPGMTECPVILGTSTLYRVMEVIKEIISCTVVLVSNLVVDAGCYGQVRPSSCKQRG